MTKNEMIRFFDNIAGEGDPLTQRQLEANRRSITEAIQSMKIFYRKHFPVGDMIRDYYEQDFKRIDAAHSDRELVFAVNLLRVSLDMQ